MQNIGSPLGGARSEPSASRVSQAPFDHGHDASTAAALPPSTNALADAVRQAPRSFILAGAMAVAYVVLYEVYSSATFHQSARGWSVVHDGLTIVPYLAPLVLLQVATHGVWRRTLVALYLGLHVLVDLAFESSRGRLDFAFVRDNLAESFSGAGAAMVLGSIPTATRIIALVELGLIVALLRTRGTTESALFARTSRQRRIGIGVAASGLFWLAFAGHLPSRDALAEFGNSIVQYYAKNGRMADARAHTPGVYPFIHEAGPSMFPSDVVPANPAHRPNVVLIMMESFSAEYLGKIAPDGAPYTPTLDRLATLGLSATRFYGNSIQTCHGQFATLCSLVPSYRKKEAYIRPLGLECLPNVLREEGYATSFYVGEEAQGFDGIDEFGARLGFEETKTALPATLTPEERAHVWGWGLQDDYFYEWALRNVENAKATRADKPFFLALAPVSNHYPFHDEPGHAPIEGEPTVPRGDYAASLRASDRRLAVFFDQLRARGLDQDTLVIVTGDHSFPSDQHGSHWNERGFYEESFRIPLVMVWPEHLPARALGEGAYSQLDIAPTVLDVLAIQRPTAFLGRSLFSPGPRFLPLVQPYDGQYLGAVAWPYKYREHGLTGRVRLFDLEADPTEAFPLKPGSVPPAVLAELKGEVERIHLNQALLQSNEIWPTAP